MEHKNWKKTFAILWTGQAVSIFTSAVIQMAIVWYITDKTKSAAALSIATLIGFLPQALLGPFVGVFIDRHDRKKIMICADLFIAAATGVLVYAGFKGEIPIVLIYVVLFLRSLGSTFHEPSLQAITPLIVPTAQLTKCAGYSQTFESVSILLSPAAAAAGLYVLFGIEKILLLDIGGAIFAMITIAFLSIPKLIKDDEKIPNVIREAKEGFKEVTRHRGLMPLLVVSTMYAIIYMPIGTLYPLITMSYFGGSMQQFSTVEIVFASGTLLGALTLGRWGEKIHKIKTIQKSIFVMGAGLICTGLLPPGGIWFFVALTFIMGTTIPYYHGVVMSVYQTKIRHEYLGRVFSLTMSINLLSMPIGLGLSGLFSQKIGMNHWFLISGIASILIAMSFQLFPSLLHSCEKGSEPDQ